MSPIVGVIEGFYGTPWSHEERLRCIDVIGGWGWNTFVWAAKLEPRHREKWDEPFTTEELTNFGELNSRHPAVRLVIGLTPGSGASPQHVIDKLGPACERGGGVTLCFDDLPVLDAATQHRDIANAVVDAFGGHVSIVPTHYCGTTSSPYLTRLCDGLHSQVEIMWTGDMVVNDSITVEQSRARAHATGGRPPLVWDNTPVNDALMSSHLHLGPFTGREEGLRETCSGWLWNPMSSQRASIVTLESAAAWWNGKDPIVEWGKVVDRDGWRLLAEATAYRADFHWPGESPDRAWWLAVQSLEDNEPTVSQWVRSARLGASLALAALDVLDASDDDMTPEFIARSTRAFLSWTDYRAQPALTLGSGPRRRPLATQNEQGKFVLTPASVTESLSLVDGLMSQALHRLAR